MADETPNSNQETANQADESTLEFLKLVNCTPEEVLETPTSRRYADHSRDWRPTPTGSAVLYFGKYKGRAIDQVPREYLEWLVKQPPMRNVNGKTKRSLEKTKRKVAAYLGMNPRHPHPRRHRSS